MKMTILYLQLLVRTLKLDIYGGEVQAGKEKLGKFLGVQAASF